MSLLDEQPGKPLPEKPLKVSELTFRMKHLLERQFASVFVEGEISNYRPAASGHLYFVLKDAGAMISCVMWAADAARLAAPPREGDTVEIRGRVTVYEPRGQYQVVVSSMRPAGQGRLYQAFLELKARLEKEGLFAPDRKRPVPRFPRAIGVVTSPTGAAIRDILKVLGRRAPGIPVFIAPARVQGEGASAEICRAIRRLNDMALPEVLIVGRGGGSIEDLWAFNEEPVARAIAGSRVPVISAVGHETDFTIADSVADLRAPTPSAAAEQAAPNAADLLREIGHWRSRMTRAVEAGIEPLRGSDHLRARAESSLRSRLDRLRPAHHLAARLAAAIRPRIEAVRGHIRAFGSNLALARPLQRVNELRQRLDDHAERMERVSALRHRSASLRLERLAAQLAALNPKSILARGYSITIDPVTNRAVRAAREARPGQALEVLLHDGTIAVHVDGAPPDPPGGRRRKGAPQTAVEWFGEPAEDN